MIPFEEEITFNNDSIIVKGLWSPSRSAPSCSDHDDPRFSDPGEPSEIDIQTINDSEELVNELSRNELEELEYNLLENLESDYYG